MTSDWADSDEYKILYIDGLMQDCSNYCANALWPLLLTWFNFNPSMDM